MISSHHLTRVSPQTLHIAKWRRGKPRTARRKALAHDTAPYRGAVLFPAPEIAVYMESTHPNNVYKSATYLNIYGAFDPVRNSYKFFFLMMARPQLTKTFTT